MGLILTATVDGVESQYTIRRSSGAPFETTALTRSYKQAFEIDFFNAVFKKVPPRTAANDNSPTPPRNLPPMKLGPPPREGPGSEPPQNTPGKDRGGR